MDPRDPKRPYSYNDCNNKLVNNMKSQVQTCEAALLLASLCSTVDSLPLSKRSSSHMTSDMMVDISSPTVDDSRNNHLQAYIKERAVKQQTMKQHQSYNSRNNSHDRNNVELSSVTSIHQKIMKSDDDAKVVTSATATTNTISSVSSQSSVSLTSSKLVVTGVGVHAGARFNEDSSNEVPSVQTSVTSATAPAVSVADSVSDLPHSVAKENALDILAKTSLASDAAKKQALKLSSVSSNSICSSVSPSGSPNKKLKAEFLPPSSGPSPSYVSMLEDGRSMCLICNKIFTKPSQMKLHVNIHYFERPFRCESCAVSFRTKGHLQKHQRSVTHLNKMSMNSTFGTATTSNPRPFKCDDCKIAFRIHGHLAKHLRSKMHIMKLECLGKLPFGTYAEMERSGINMNDIDTSDCENSLESLQLLAQKLYEKDPTKLGQWDPSEMLPLSAQHQHRSNSSSAIVVVDHHGSLTQHQNYHQHHDQMNDDASSNDDEENDNETVNESPSSDVNDYSLSASGASTMIVNRNNVNLNSIPSTVSITEDIGDIGNKQFAPKGKYHLSSSDNGMIPIMVPTQSPVQQSVHHILKKKFPNNIDPSFPGTVISNKSTSGTETQYSYLKKMPPPTGSSVISSSVGVISSVTDYTSSSASKLTDSTINISTNNSSLLDVSGYNKNSKFKIEEDQSKSVVTSSIVKPNPGVLDLNSSDNSNMEYRYNRNINTGRGTNCVATTSSASSVMNVFCSNANISSYNNKNSSSDLSSNRSVIQRLNCNLDQSDQFESDSSIVNSYINSDEKVHKNNDGVNVGCRKADVGGGSQDGSSDRNRFSCSETVIENLDTYSERTKVNINSSVSAPSSVEPCESLTDSKISASTATSDSLSTENCS